MAKVFVTGRSQAVRLPKSCRFDSAEVYARRVGHSVVLTPKDDEWADAIRAMFASFEAGADLARADEWPQAEREPLR